MDAPASPKPTPHAGFTESVKAAQSRLGSRTAYARVEEKGGSGRETGRRKTARAA